MQISAISLAVGLAAVACAATGQASLAAECTCRAGGRDHEVGRTLCLSTPQGFRLATCGMVMNNTSWRFSDTPCAGVRQEGAGADVAIIPAPEASEPGG